MMERQTESATSLPASGQHLKPVGGDDANVSGPRPFRRNQYPHEWLDILGRGGMNSEQNDTGSFERDPALHRNLPEVLVQRQ